MLDTHSHTTLQYQLRSKLVERMERGDWQAGQKIMSEREICEEYGVSRITVREVCAALEREGMLTRRQGKGTFVTSGVKQDIRAVYHFMDFIRQKGHRVTTRLLEFSIVPCMTREARELSISDGELVYRVERLRSIDGALFSLEVSYIPVSAVPGMTETAVKENGITAVIKELTGLEPDGATEIIEAVSCPDKPSMMIGIKRDSPVLRVRRITKAGGKNLRLCDSIVKQDRHKYELELR